jgi:hypothetical protein
MHVNSRSLRCNLNRLTDLLFSLELQFSVIGVTETWLNDSSAQLVNIDGLILFQNVDRIGLKEEAWVYMF